MDITKLQIMIKKKEYEIERLQKSNDLDKQTGVAIKLIEKETMKNVLKELTS